VLDGLRGLAVVAVVLFHFAPDQVPGGFLGVDVFFVLSGFLLTSLVLVEHHNNSRISLSGFWNRRIRRLLPAALVTVVVSVAIAFVLEPDYTRSTLRGEALAAITYVANWWTIGHGQSYASSFGPQSPVAHFWSLAVEEQFYLLFPFLILGLVSLIAVATRRNLARPELQRLSIALLIVAVLGTLASAIAMVVIHTPGTDPSREYLGTDTRVQTIFVGVALACIWYLVPRRPDSEMRKFAVPAGTALLAALLLAIAFTDFRSDWLYQGGFTIIAIGIAALIWILARHGSATTNHVLESGPMRRLGEVSYGLYLWHWPVMVFLNPQRTGLDGLALFSLRILVTAVATTVSFVLIERPLRRPRGSTEPLTGSPEARDRNRKLLRGWGTASLAAVLCVLILTVAPVVEGNASTASPPSTAQPVTTTRPGELPVDPPYTALWIGDSVMWTLGGGGPIVFPQPSSYTSPFDPTKLVIWNRAVYPCEILRYPSRFSGLLRAHNSNCDNNDWAIATGVLQPQIIVFSAVVSDTYDRYINGRLVEFGTPEFDQIYLDALDRTIRPLTGGLPQIVLLDQPLPFTVYEPNGRPSENWRVIHMGELFRRYAASHPRVSVVDLKPIVCPTDPCSNRTPGDEAIRNDGLHFTQAGMEFLSPAIADAIIAAARSTGIPPVVVDTTISENVDSTVPETQPVAAPQ